MERFGDTVLGLWMFGVGYAVHFLMYPFWNTKTLLRWLAVPLSIASWSAFAGLVLIFKEFVHVVRMAYEFPSVSTVLDVFVFVSLALLFGLAYQHADMLKYSQLKPFFRESLLFRHSARVKSNIFAQGEQNDIQRLIKTQGDVAALQSLESTRTPIDRTKEINELRVQRKERSRNALKSAFELCAHDQQADITDFFQLTHFQNPPHPYFHKTFRVIVDPVSRMLRLHVVFDQFPKGYFGDAKRWFRFKQELFDFSENVYTREWIMQFSKFFEHVEIECHQEEEDSFGVPQRGAFLRVQIPVSVLEFYKEGVFIVTELEKQGVVTWIGDEYT